MIVEVAQGGNVSSKDIKTVSLLNTGAATAAVLTITKIDSKTRINLLKVYWSYSADPTGGKLTITGGTVSFEIDITKGGPAGLTLGPYVASLNTDVVITLASGAGGVVGKLNADYILNKD